MKEYNFKKIESKWQKFWEKNKFFRAKDFSKRPKYYCLIEFPYPSGEGLHVGHTRSNTAMDIIARKRRMEDYNVLFPIGWDAFGLPTENYAIKTGIHPKIITKRNADNFRRQLKSFGFSFDWSREIDTSDPEYYKWTQWIFLQFFKRGLAYKKKMPINWCPSCKIGLANEEVIDAKCERCETPVQKKEKEQWLLAITKYADRLLKDLDKVDYLEKIKIQQQNWIGRSEGALIDFMIQDSRFKIQVFTTRADTIFGATYLVLAPEHSFVQEQIRNSKSEIRNKSEIQNYLNKVKQKSELQRTDLTKEKTGVELKGIKAINPATKKEIPVFVADYVLSGYGTGAIMAVPAHDERDAEFAKKFKLPFSDAPLVDADKAIKLVNGKKQVQYHLRDWIFSRQHYWGEPIPIIHCDKCGDVPVPEKDLPVKLPDIKKYQPTDTGESPLANVKNWVNTKCPKCKGPAKRETDTMPNWAGSSWYYLAYIMRGNSKFEILNSKLFKYWMPVDWYNGGMEHTTLHLLYSRFWNKFLYDIKAAPTSEPYKKRTSHGMILGEDGEKMSKSRDNVINPDEIVKNYGADAYRLYQMFMGPFDQTIPWDSHGIEGTKRFLTKVWNLKFQIPARRCYASSVAGGSNLKSQKLETLLHQTIKKVTEDIEGMKFNTAISSLMILVNELEKEKKLHITHYALLVTLLAPFAPHIANELAEKLGFKIDKWPKYDAKKIKEETFELVIQINGKVRDRFEVKMGIPQKEAEVLTLKRENVKKYLSDKKVKKVIFVPNRLINYVCS
ncbi:MAG: class I tRNA ligase family protein [Candidatus Parcubacteria bacterium]|nr:class I tRNA ligase family protein [Candidatus Parcubacteria bacterium]